MRKKIRKTTRFHRQIMKKNNGTRRSHIQQDTDALNAGTDNDVNL